VEAHRQQWMGKRMGKAIGWSHSVTPKVGCRASANVIAHFDAWPSREALMSYGSLSTWIWLFAVGVVIGLVEAFWSLPYAASRA
jgi:hypothetical protein